MTACPCGSEQTYDDCCGPFHRGEAWPETAEQLMRSRYTAFCKVDIDYLKESSLPKQRPHLDLKGMRRWARAAEWLRLDIEDTAQGRAQDHVGYVSFTAVYRQDGEVEHHREDAVFHKVDGRWYYDDGEGVPVETFVREQPKVSRNDPCPCGSGKRYKKCCG